MKKILNSELVNINNATVENIDFAALELFAGGSIKEDKK
jgi:hypothetical protein